MDVELRRVAAEDAGIISSLVDDYLSELGQHREIAVGPRDAASYRYLPLYWSEPGRYPFSIWCKGSLVGFVLIRQVESEGSVVCQVSEFFIEPDSRRRGLGSAAAAVVWRSFPGRWELQVHLRNRAAIRFWSSCAKAVAEGPVQVREVTEEDGRRLQYEFSVESGSPC